MFLLCRQRSSGDWPSNNITIIIIFQEHGSKGDGNSDDLVSLVQATRGNMLTSPHAQVTNAHATPCSSHLILTPPHAHATACSRHPLLTPPHAHSTPCSLHPMLTPPHAHATPCSRHLLLTPFHAHATPCSRHLLLTPPHAQVTHAHASPCSGDLCSRHPMSR